MTLVQTAKVAGLTVEEVVALLGEAGISAVDYAPGELLAEEGYRLSSGLVHKIT